MAEGRGGDCDFDLSPGEGDTFVHDFLEINYKVNVVYESQG